MQDRDSLSDAIELRRRAIERLKEQGMDETSVQTGQDAVRLVHELQVHQIELEMQNEALQQSQTESEASLERYIHLYDFAPVGYFTLNRDGFIRQVNLTGAKLLGVARIHLANTRFGLFVSPESQSTFQDFIGTAFASRETKSCEVVIQTKEGDQVYTRINTAEGSDDGERRISVVDVTAGRQADGLRAASLYSRNLIETSLDPLVTISAEGKITDVNTATEKITGVSRERLMGSNFADYFTQPEMARAGYAKVFVQGQVTDYPLAIRHTSGAITEVQYNASVYRNEQGQVIGVLAAARDITERKQVEEALQTASLYSRNLIETSLDPLVTISAEGKITDVNTATEKITGVSRERLMGSDFVDYFTQPEMARAGYAKVFVQGQVTDYPLAIRHTSGAITEVQYNASVYRNKQGQVIGVVAAARDITERKRAELARLEYRNRQLELLNKTARALSVSLDTSQVMANIGAALQDYMQSSAGRIFIFNSKNDLVLQYCWGIKDESAFKSLARANFIGREAIDSSSTITIETAELIPDYVSAGYASMRYVCIPLLVDGVCVGAIDFTVEATQSHEEAETSLCNILGQQAAIAIRNANIYEKARHGEEQLHRLSRQLLRAQESERRSIARELHDEIGSSVAALSLSLELIAGKASDSKSHLNRTKQIVSELSDHIHGLTLDLRPPLLDGFGIIPALRCHIDRYAERTGISVSFIQSGVEQEKRFDSEIESCVFRIAQEALTNVAKHAQTTSASVELVVDENSIDIVVRDAGCGCDLKSSLEKDKSTGLIGMHERASVVGGELQVESHLGVGTRIHAKLPNRDPIEVR